MALRWSRYCLSVALVGYRSEMNQRRCGSFLAAQQRKSLSEEKWISSPSLGLQHRRNIEHRHSYVVGAFWEWLPCEVPSHQANLLESSALDSAPFSWTIGNVTSQLPFRPSWLFGCRRDLVVCGRHQLLSQKAIAFSIRQVVIEMI